MILLHQSSGGLSFFHDSNTIKRMRNTTLLRIVSRIVFFLGVSLGFALAVIMTWSRMEAIHYFFMGATDEPFKGLHCPVMISPKEKGVITAVFNNPTDQDVNFFYRVQISGQDLAASEPEYIVVSPGQTNSAHFVVDAGNVDLGFFIFAKMNLFPNALHGSREAVCGILVTDLLGLSGAQISAAALSLSFLGMAIGLGVGQKTGASRDQNTARVMQVLMLSVLSALFAGAMGWWMAGMALSTVTMLLMIISVRFA